MATRTSTKYELDGLLGRLPWILDRSHLLPLYSMGKIRRLEQTLAYQPLKGIVHGRLPRLRRVLDRVVRAHGAAIPVRIYQPAPGPLPLVMFFHGGGFALGNVAIYDGMCRRLAYECGATLVSVEYRRAPEHRFPSAVEDCYDALEWAVRNAEDLGVDPSISLVAGDSAGGNLAAVTCLVSRSRGGPRLDGQVLIYPGTDCTLSQPSLTRLADAPVLTRALMERFVSAYIRSPADRLDPWLSPLLEPDLSGLPDAFVITAEHDPLRDDGMAYATRLLEAGNRVRVLDFPRVPHGFLSFPALTPQGRRAYRDIGAFVREIVDRRRGRPVRAA